VTVFNGVDNNNMDISINFLSIVLGGTSMKSTQNFFSARHKATWPIWKNFLECQLTDAESLR